MNIESILDMIDEVLESSWNVPLSGGRSVVDAETIRNLIDDIRLNIPMEIRHAQAIVADRGEIIEKAKKESDLLIKKAEQRARILVEQDEITKTSKEKSAEMISEARLQSKAIMQAAADYATKVVNSTEAALLTSLGEVREVKNLMKNKK